MHLLRMRIQVAQRAVGPDGLGEFKTHSGVEFGFGIPPRRVTVQRRERWISNVQFIKLAQLRRKNSLRSC